jgi:ankyrin repeat protein
MTKRSNSEPISYTCARDKPLEYFEALLHHGLRFDPKTDGPTLLCQAAWVGNLPVMTYLLDRGVDPNIAGIWAMSDHGKKPYMAKALENALVDGQTGSAKLLLSRGAKSENYTFIALQNRYPKIVKLLWDAGVREISPLCYAVSQDASPADIQKILDQGSPADPPQDKQITPLGVAANMGNLDVVKLLIAHHADPNSGGLISPKAPQYWRRTPLILAAAEGQDEVVTYLLQHGANPDPSALYQAGFNSTPYSDVQRTKDHFEKTVRILLDAGALKNITPDMAGLVLAGPLGTRQGPPNATVLKMLLDAGLSPELPMPYLAENGEKPDTVIGYYRKFYQKFKNNPSYQTVPQLEPLLNMLEAADKATPPSNTSTLPDPPPAMQNSAATVPAKNPALDKQLVDVARDGHTDKVGAGDADKVAQLLAQGADPNAKDERGTTALIWALNFGKDDAAALLIQKGADVNAAEGNMPAVEVASSLYDCPKALDLLLHHGARIPPPDAQGHSVIDGLFLAHPPAAGKWNYLHDRDWTDAEYRAWVQRQRRVIDLLAAAGVDFNGPPGATPPLIRAIQNGNLEAARAFLAHGIKVDVRDASGNTPLSTAQAFHPEFVPELRAAEGGASNRQPPRAGAAAGRLITTS